MIKNYSVVHDRVYNGWSLKDAIEKDNSSNSIIVEYNGVEYSSISSACDALDVNDSSVRKLIGDGMPFRDAVEYLKHRGNGFNFDNKWFESLDDVAKYIGVSKSFISSRMRRGMSFKDACQCAVEYVKSPKILIVGIIVQRRKIRDMLGEDITACNEWLTRIFLDSPTEFNGVVYSSVNDACKKLGDLRVSSIQNAMLDLLTFQEAVHKVYYVLGDMVFKRGIYLRDYLEVNQRIFNRIMQESTSNDEVVSKALKHRGSIGSRPCAVSSKDVNGFVRCDSDSDTFIAYCAVCGRPVVLSKEELKIFSHSDGFCKSRVQLDIYDSGISVDALRHRLSKNSYKSVIEAIKSGVGSRSSLSQSVKSLPDVSSVKAMADGRYALIRCSVCGKTVMLQSKIARRFKHSSLCKEYEWLEV